MTVEKVTTAKSFADLYADGRACLPGADLPDFAALRDAAMRRVLELGLPTARLEQWRYTPALAKRLDGLGLTPAEAETGALPAPLSAPAQRVCLRNGCLAGPLPEAEGLTLRTLEERLAQDPERLLGELRADAESDSLFVALNLALLQDALFVEAARERPEPTLEIDQRADAGLANPRLHLRLRAGARVLLIERLRGGGFANRRVAIELEPGASLAHFVEMDEEAEATQLGETAIRVQRDATYRGYLLYGGRGLARQDMEIALAERGASAVLNGGYLLKGRAHGDLTSHIRHAAPDTASSSVFKGVLDERARQVFRGKITVEAGAARADGRMTNKTLLLSDQAEIDSKPELMIFHDEVQCAHGATSGMIDEEALFYLRSRGLPPASARRLLLRSFLEETLTGLADDFERRLAESRLDRRLQEIAG